MLKKIIALGLSVVTVLTMASCTGGKKASKNSEYPNKLELTVWETQGTDYAEREQPDENIVGDWLVGKTNVEVTNMYGNGGGQWDTKLTKLVAGGNLPDIVHCGAGQGPSHFAKLDELDLIWELTPEMLQKYAPNVWKRIPQRLWDKMTVNGKILGIPYFIDATYESQPDATKEEVDFINETKVIPYNDMTFSNEQCLWIRDDILRKFYPEAKTYDELVEILNERQEPIGDELLDIPIDSTEEYIQFMYDIADLGLKENGKKVYAFGYGGGDNWEALAWLGADMYGYKGHYYTGTWNDVKQQIEIPLVGDVVRQAAKTQNEMINDKVIDMESLAHTSAIYSEKVLNGQYAIVPIDLVGFADDINKQLKERGKKFSYRPFITQVPRLEGYGAYKEETTWVESVCFLNSLKEEELYQVLNWVNVQFSDEYEEVLNWGPKEKELYTEKDGVRRFKDERFNKYFIDGDSSALELKDTMGLGGVNTHRINGIFSFRVSNYSRWTPSILAKKNPLVPSMISGFKFKSDSEHVKNVKVYPPCQVWSSIYAEVPEVIDYWAEREQWEGKFKLAMAAKKNDFDTKWDAAVKAVNDIANIESMEKKMTKIAKDYLSN